MLSDIKNYLSCRETASVVDLAHHLDVSPAAIQAMLNHWVRKGRVKRAFSCGGCHGCGGLESEVYTWVTVTDCSEKKSENEGGTNLSTGTLCRG